MMHRPGEVSSDCHYQFASDAALGKFRDLRTPQFAHTPNV